MIVNWLILFSQEKRTNGVFEKTKLIESQAAGFDADSEGSDSEILPSSNNSTKSSSIETSSAAASTPVTAIAVSDQNMDTGKLIKQSFFD